MEQTAEDLNPFTKLGINTNEIIINLSLTLGDIVDSVAKALAAQQRSLDSLVKIALNNRIGFYPILFK